MCTIIKLNNLINWKSQPGVALILFGKVVYLSTASALQTSSSVETIYEHHIFHNGPNEVAGILKAYDRKLSGIVFLC